MASLRSFNSAMRNSQAGVIDPMQVDAPPEENDNNEEELYEVDVDSFDLEAYANNYHGLARIYRLMYIADHCQKMRSDALRLAISHVITTMNANLYQVLHQKLQQSVGNILPDVTGANPIDSLPTFNPSWVETTTQKAAMKLEKLDGDLKNYKSNSIKESIRRGHNEIGDHYVNCGDLIEATKSYSKARDYCTSSSHVISMCLNIIKVGIYLQNWSHVVNYIIKAESTPDYTENSDLQTTYSSTLKCMTGLAELAGRKYKIAAQNFLQANLDYWDTNCEVMTPNDVAVYGGLCALATFSRSELQTSVISNNIFKLFLELEPEVRDAIFKFYESKYEVCLKILNKIKPTLLLDMYIGSHINTLYSNIRSKAMIQYFSPYDSADLRKMAMCFNTSLTDLENELMQLILDGHIKARIDSINKILYARHPNQRVETFEKAMSMAQQYSRYTHILILKSQMIKHQINAKAGERHNNIGKTINVDFVKL
ncbi:COP9 signalosome complex subunit 1b [Daktulosphaira vitifoliae]|uniref:COP9 signalosome complex subunit 1b n=1 Tax=Daktulosphaira vitifoliae TaxID=58002 RepID=UPI0021AAA71D|nr:COP9 signalosome complex subunit 1b [Daktulosphaira vitifoliae]